MTVSHLSTKFFLALASIALATACADVGGNSTPATEEEFPVVKSTDQDVIVCQSIRTSIQRDIRDARTARAAGNEIEAKRKQEAAQAGVDGAATVKGCDVSDIAPTQATPTATPS